jgi:2-polyprenyl-3-methyl-5-hydroxy-6-metoxy-1,4-benzoquinol methylase
VKVAHVNALVSPITGLSMNVRSVEAQQCGEIKEGLLVDASATHTVSIRDFIPRFVTDGSYTNSFGQQWNRYRSIQIDGENKLGLSAERFYRWTGWKKDELRGLRILEAGCGAGRFTQVMLEAGADVYSLDMSSAVDACWRTNAPHEKLCLVQADLYHIPFKAESFDRVFCYGVLQHTPDPRQAFFSLVRFLRPGGKIAIDCYIKSKPFTRWTSKYLWRPVTRRVSPQTLFKIIEWYVPKWLPIDTKLASVPWIGHRLVGVVPCWNYTGMWPLSREQIKQWAILDTFDALSPQYDKPQTCADVLAWFQQAGLSDVQVGRGSNGIIGNATKP